MKSNLLESIGLQNSIATKKYNFKYKNNRDKIGSDMKNFLAESNLNPKIIFTAIQTHSNSVVDAKGGDDFIYGKIIPNVDGLVTNNRDTALVIKFADCTPVVLYDPVKKVQASVHSGWRGTSTKISEIAIEKLISDYNSKREDIYAFIGPSIDFNLYEVGSDVYDEFKHFKNRDLFFKRESKDKFKLNMKLVNEVLLLENGILKKHIEVSKEHTYSNPNLHSARRDGINYGLNAIVTLIK